MRKKCLLLLLMLSMGCFSQNHQISYNFTSLPQSLLSNPGADVKFKWYFGVPLLSNVYVNAGSSGFSAYSLFADNGVNFNDKLKEIVFSTNSKDVVVANQQLEVFSGGFRLGGREGNSYLTFGMYQEFDFISYMPKDLAILALYGNKDYIGKVFDLGDLVGSGELLAVYHLGYHKQLNEKVILGVRGKIYSSIFNVSSTNNQGYIYTVPNNVTVYEQVIESDLQVNTSGISKYKDNYDGDVMKDITGKALFGGNLGLGFDAGITYYPQKNVQFTASFTDIGYIKHTNEVESFTYKGKYRFNGINLNFYDGSTVENAIEDFKEAIPLDSISDDYKTQRPVKFNSSIQYAFDEERSEDCVCDEGTSSEFKSAVGAQFFAMSTPKSPLLALTAYYRRKLFDSLQMKATYTIDTFSAKNFGLGLSGRFGLVNLYLLADNLLAYQDLSKTNALSLQFGLNIIFREGNERE